jgi:hypothetical protein
MSELRATSLLLVCAFLAPSTANAKPLDPVTVHERILKRGVGNWICVEEANGIALVGRVVSIGNDSVGLQLENYPEVTTVFYRDIVGLRMGWSKKALWTVLGVSLGVTAAMVGVGIHEMNENRANFPSLHAAPAGP